MKPLFSLCFSLLFSCLSVQAQGLETQLRALSGVLTVDTIPAKAHFKAGYRLEISQPLDHSAPEKGSFVQQVYLFHADAAAPMVMETEGYKAVLYPRELSEMLQANQLNVEHRFHGKSVPESPDWHDLNAKQAADDLHRIRELLRNLYPGKWLSSGISKGGENTLLYRKFYPKDVDVSVAYVAPVIHGREDPRVWNHVNTVGSAKCREAIVEFQREMLLRREEMIGMLKVYALEKDHKFSLDYGKVLEYAAMEFSFSFWQWGGDCKKLPGKDAETSELFLLVDNLVSWDFYCDSEINRLSPSYYQHSVELGYYGFDATPVQDLIKSVTVFDNTVFAPQLEDLTYDPTLITSLETFLAREGDQILYVYGAYDTWGACAYEPEEARDALFMRLKKGDHRTRIQHFPRGKQKKVCKKLEEWMGTEVQPLKKKK